MTTIIHEYKVHDKIGFEAELSKIVVRYRAAANVIWGCPVSHKATVETPDGESMEVTVVTHPVTVEFDFAEYRVKGFTYIGCIKDAAMMGLITVHGNELAGGKTDGSEIVEFVKSFDSIPCHNCGRNHTRKIGHVFRTDETGELVVFGSSCAKNYFGVDFDRLLSFFERVNNTFSEGWDDDYVRNYCSSFIDWKKAACIAYYSIKNFGYLSGAKAREWGKSSTADMVREVYNSDPRFRSDYQTRIIKEVNEMHKANEFPDMTIMTEKNYAGKTEGLNDFEHNMMTLQEMMKANTVTFNMFGFLAYLVYKEFFHVDECPEKVEIVIPEWAVKGYKIKKDEKMFNCKVVNVHSFAGSYNITYIYTFICDNVRFKWFASSDQNVAVGDDVILNGFTVKGTEDNKYGKSVIITRANLMNPATGEPANGKTRAPRQTKHSYSDKIGADLPWSA